MTKGLNLYLTVNQLLVGKPYGRLPNSLREFLEQNNFDKLYDAASKVKREDMTNIEKTFLNLLRVPGYAINVQSTTGRLLSLTTVADVVRNNNMDPKECYSWGINLIVEAAKERSSVDLVSDGKLSMCQKTFDEQEDLVVAMERAFTKFCWGTFTPNSTTKGIVRTVLEMMNPDGTYKMSEDKIADMLGRCVAQKISLCDIGQSVMLVSDLADIYQKFGGMFFWGDESRKNVTMVLRKHNSDDAITLADLSADSFYQLFGENQNLMERIYAKGSKVEIVPMNANKDNMPTNAEMMEMYKANHPDFAG